MKEKITLLIVDDDEDDRHLFIESARDVDESIICLTANDGQDALQLLKNTEELPDYIFLDLRMPRFSGKRTLQEIKKDGRLQHIPVIVYTTSRQVEDANELKKMGAAHFISKPANPD